MRRTKSMAIVLLAFAAAAMVALAMVVGGEIGRAVMPAG